MVTEGWNTLVATPERKPYANRKGEGILLWGSHVIVPPKLRERVLDTLQRRPHRNGENEGTRSKLCLVARTRQRNRGAGQTLHWMSTSGE